MTAVLQADGLLVGYGGRPVLAGIDLELRANEVLCLIGHNGAGKSTLLKALFGLVPRQGGRILLDGVELAAPEPRALTARGISLVPEGRGVFPGLTVAEIWKMALWAAGIPERGVPHCASAAVHRPRCRRAGIDQRDSPRLRGNVPPPLR